MLAHIFSWVVPFKVLLDQTVDATIATTLYMSFVPWAEGERAMCIFLIWGTVAEQKKSVL